MKLFRAWLLCCRRNSEKRKEKSRDAARCRRSKESEIFTDMAQLLPIATSLSSQLDKASIMRLTIAFLQTRSLLGNSKLLVFFRLSCLICLNCPSSLLARRPRAVQLVEWRRTIIFDRSLLAESPKWHAVSSLVRRRYHLSQRKRNPATGSSAGKILSLANTFQGKRFHLKYSLLSFLDFSPPLLLALWQVDLIGHSIYDYCHPCDHDELREVLSLRPDDELARSFFLRLKSTLSAKGRSNPLKASSYKVSAVDNRFFSYFWPSSLQISVSFGIPGNELFGAYRARQRLR